jgi:TctA family transporter
MLISRGDFLVFVERPISAFFLFLCLVLIVAQIYVRLRKPKVLADSNLSIGEVSQSLGEIGQ